MFRVFLLLSLGVSAFGQIQYNGTCPQGSMIVNVNLTQFAGTWNELERIPNTDQTGDCSTQQYQVTSENTGTLTLSEGVGGKLVNTTGNITKTTANNVTKLTFNYGSNDARDYYVIATDYTSYALIYSCRSINNSTINNAWAWKLSRNKTHWGTNTAIDSAVATIPALSGVQWHLVNHTSCTNGSFSNVASPLLAVLALFFATKDFLFSR